MKGVRLAVTGLTLTGLALAGLTLSAIANPARAEEAPMPPWPPSQPSPGGDAGALASAAIEQLIRALGAALQNLPQYEMPALNERGDVIIRRKNPKPPEPFPNGPDEAQT